MGLYAERVFPWIMDHLETERIARLRSQALASARGDVLELGFGTGHNLDHYPSGTRSITAIEPSAGMTRRARERDTPVGRPVRLVRGDAQQLPFPDATFDTVTAVLVLCTIPSPDRALAEARRVLRPDGALLFFEHVAAEDARLRRWQSRIEPFWKPVACGCHLARRTETSITRAGFRLETIEHIDLPDAPPVVRSAIIGRAEQDRRRPLPALSDA